MVDETWAVKFEQRIEQSILDYDMIRPLDQVIVGVSGGADSVCLLLVLSSLRRKLSCELAAVHVEHGLRGESALEDARFTEMLCDQLHVPCRIVHVDAAAEAAAKGLSIEEAGRLLRYEAFAQAGAELLSKRHPQASIEGQNNPKVRIRIATAHHAEDQAETMLLNLARGTGLTGLGGIRPAAGSRIRPLLFVQRSEIEAYLQIRCQNWRTDETNGQTDYARNRIRLQVMPVLQETVNTRAAQHFSQTALDLQRCDAYLEKLAREKMDGRVYQMPANGHQAGGHRGEICVRIPVELLTGEDPLIQEYILRLSVRDLREGMALKDISRLHIRQLLHLAGQDCGHALNLPAGLYAVRERDELVLKIQPVNGVHNQEMTEEKQERLCEVMLKLRSSVYEKDTEDGEVDIPEGWDAAVGKVAFRVLQPEEVPAVIPEKKYTKWLQYDTMGDDICLRTRQTGDYLVVNAQGGRRKLKDYFIDQKIPRDQRDTVLLIAQGSHILWIIGGRISEAAKIGSSSGGCLQVQAEPREGKGPAAAGEDE